MSSKNYTKTKGFGGILSNSSEQTPMWNANKAYLPYCSSDLHFGNLGGDNNTTELWGYKFRGTAQVKAMLKHLIDHQGLG